MRNQNSITGKNKKSNNTIMKFITAVLSVPSKSLARAMSETFSKSFTKKRRLFNNLIYTICGVLFMAIMVIGTTTITDNKVVTTGDINASSFNNILYVQAGNFSDIAVAANRCASGGICKVILPKGEYHQTGNGHAVRVNTTYEGQGAVIYREANSATFGCNAGDAITNDITFRGIKFVDNESAVRTTNLIRLVTCNVTNVNIENNEFWYVPNGTSAVYLGDVTAPEHWATNVRVINNKFMYVHSGFVYEGESLHFTGNYLLRGNVGPSGESEGIDWNGMQENGTGGVVANNIFINFTEQGIDINGHHVVISGNTVVQRSDGATTTCVNSVGNSYGSVIGNVCVLSNELQDNGFKIRSRHYDTSNDEGGQTFIGNIVTSPFGVGTGVEVMVNGTYNILEGNSFQNLSNGIYFDDSSASNNYVGQNAFRNVAVNVNDTGSNNSFKFASKAESTYNITTTSWLVGASLSILKTAVSYVSLGIGDILTTGSNIFYRNNETANGAVVYIDNENATDDENTLHVVSKANDESGASAGIYLDAYSRGLHIQQQSTLNGSSPYNTFDFPTLALIRGSSTRGSNLIMGNNNGKWDLYADVSNMELYNSSSSKIYQITQGQLINIQGTALLRTLLNSTGRICDSTTEGGIYYDGSTKKHYGCNLTSWNALY